MWSFNEELFVSLYDQGYIIYGGIAGKGSIRIEPRETTDEALNAGGIRGFHFENDFGYILVSNPDCLVKYEY